MEIHNNKYKELLPNEIIQSIQDYMFTSKNLIYG